MAGRARGVPQWAEETLSNDGEYATDCSTTPNNNRAAVRHADPTFNDVVISVWKLDGPYTGTPPPAALLAQFGGGSMKSGNRTDFNFAPSNLRGYHPSDRIELTNALGISIGSGDSGGSSAVSNDETYVEFFDLTTSPPTFGIQYVYSLSSSDPDYEYEHAGLAHDLAITRNGEWAVVNSDNWIHVYDLTQFPTAIATYAFNIGNIDYSTTPPTSGFNSACSPNRAVDSVAVTNERMVVTTARASGPSGTFRTWVYIVDLTTSGGPSIALQDELAPPSTWTPDEEGDRPHDVAISAARVEDRIVVVTTTHGLVAYDLLTNLRIGSFEFDEHDWRRYQKQVDSVELTDEHALILADNDSGGPKVWQVQVWDISTSAGVFSPNTYKSSDEEVESHAHDLAIEPQLDAAIARVSLENVFITGLTAALETVTVVASSNASDAYAYEAYFGATSHFVFSSDSAVICRDAEGDIHAATIGGDLAGGVWSSYVDLLDSTSSGLAYNQVPLTLDSSDDFGGVPADLAFAATRDEVVVRTTNVFPEGTPNPGPDVVRVAVPYSSGTPIVASYGGTGVTAALDSLATQPTSNFIASFAKRVLSVSEDPFTGGNDYTHRNK
jgi:hypothetical protein